MINYFINVCEQVGQQLSVKKQRKQKQKQWAGFTSYESRQLVREKKHTLVIKYTFSSFIAMINYSINVCKTGWSTTKYLFRLTSGFTFAFCFRVSSLFFFFFKSQLLTILPCTIYEFHKLHFSVIFSLKWVHIFTNYFVIVFSIFNKNKLYPNETKC